MADLSWQSFLSYWRLDLYYVLSYPAELTPKSEQALPLQQHKNKLLQHIQRML